MLSDLLIGRPVLFLASATPSAPRDLYRARGRVTPEGRVLSIGAVRNLTSTPLGDDHALAVEGEHAAFATFVYGQEQTVTWLDLRAGSGEGLEPDALVGRFTQWLSRYDETGSFAGLRRVEVSLVPPARAVGLELQPGRSDLSIDLVDDNGKRVRARLDGARGEIFGAGRTAHVEVVRHLPKRLVLWAVDTARAYVGPGPIAWLEEHVFAARDLVRRTSFRFGATSPTAEATLIEPGAPAVAHDVELDASRSANDDVHWPPDAIPSIWRTREPGEGEWQEPRLSWVSKREPAGDGPPAQFYRTFVRPDPDRPYSRVLLVALDMRQLDLAMEAGTEDPKPLTGGHGPGRIPRDPSVASKVVAAFNGGFKTEHGNYGMMVDRRVLLPPQPNAATVVVLKDRSVGFGTWGDSHELVDLQGIPSDDILSFRQNLDPLVDRGEVNPMGRTLWGYTLPGSGMQTERSGLCVTGAGQVIYAWGDDVSGSALGKALKEAGCAYAMHLDMNPHHTGFVFTKINDVRTHNYRSELLTPLMTVSPERYIEYAPKDFFYVSLHEGTPPPVESVPFRPDPGVQPPPAWAPAIWSAEIPSAAGKIDLLRITAGRARFRIRAGSAEPDAKTGALPLRDLDVDDAHRVSMVLGLGHAVEKHPRGLVVDGRVTFPAASLSASDAEPSTAMLSVSDGGTLSLERSDAPLSIAPHADMTELPLVLDGGVVVPESRRAGPPSLRSALCVSEEGTTFVARGEVVADAPLAEVLAKAGCTRAVALDRGAHVGGSLQRIGGPLPTHHDAAQTSLYVLSLPMKPRAFRFEASAKAARPPGPSDHR